MIVLVASKNAAGLPIHLAVAFAIRAKSDVPFLPLARRTGRAARIPKLPCVKSECCVATITELVPLMLKDGRTG
jgi:hypothetical protein